MTVKCPYCGKYFRKDKDPINCAHILEHYECLTCEKVRYEYLDLNRDEEYE